MNFVSEMFVAFFLVLWVLFVALPARFRLPLLLAGSYLFYATWSLPFLLVILVTTSIDYWLSNIIHRSESHRTRVTALVSGLVINLVILFFFKYFNFFLDTGNQIAGFLHLAPPFKQTLSIILPLGISFYTFEAISYMVDVYRGSKPAQNWWEYNFYIMYFPHLISGPIVRFVELVDQYRKPLELPSFNRMARGIELIVLGYLFKVVVADQAAGLVNDVFTKPQEASVLATYLAALGFTVQIYFDFMGYTHIARGVSLLFNIELPLNFNFPYLAQNISDFWKRWHISLSRWIRDYLYIPLGGSRGTMLKTVTILIVTMTLCGAWHGAGWPYILWGTYHGVLLAIGHLYKTIKNRVFSTAFTDGAFYQTIGIAMTFICVVVGWVLFRAPNMGVASHIIGKLANVPELLGSLESHNAVAVFQLFLLLAICFVTPGMAASVRQVYKMQTLPVRTAIASAALLFCWIMSAKAQVPFIYFQF